MGVLEVLPPGAQLEFYPKERAAALDRILGEPKALWSDEVCDALNRLIHAGHVLRTPSTRQIVNPLIQSTSMYVLVKVPRPADKPRLLEALVAADSGDHAPADRLASDWLERWPGTCGWRLDMACELWRMAEEPTTVGELWARLRRLPYVKGLKKETVYSSVLRAVRAGELSRTPESGALPPSRWEFIRSGERVVYDPLLLRSTAARRREKREARADGR